MHVGKETYVNMKSGKSVKYKLNVVLDLKCKTLSELESQK